MLARRSAHPSQGVWKARLPSNYQAMWNHSGQAAGFAHIMGVNVVHKVDSKVTNPILLPQEIRRIVATKSEAFTIVRQSDVWSHSEPL